MKDFKVPKIVRLILGGSIVLMLGGLTGWYFYLHLQQQGTIAVDTARGFGVPAPSFGGTVGSTQANQSATIHTFDANGYSQSRTSSSFKNR